MKYRPYIMKVMNGKGYEFIPYPDQALSRANRETNVDTLKTIYGIGA